MRPLLKYFSKMEIFLNLVYLENGEYSMDHDLEEIKQKLDIVEFIGQYVNLKKAGASYKGICPFHEERTPSFMVSPDKQIFKCFGCGEGGDIFSFVQKRENLDFPETVKLLADRAGVTLTRSNAPSIGADTKNHLFLLNKYVAAIFHKLLTDHPSGKPALEYLKKRNVSEEMIKKFNLGWAPNQTDFLHDLCRKKGFTEKDFNQIGSPERLRGRITFPLTDILGNVVGFSGRTLDPNRQPKYLNTPDTIIFHKSNIIFNLSNCRDMIKKNNRVVLVEGQMDVVASVQAGILETVATSGTALTETQLRILFRYTDKLIIAYDADAAGINASKRAIQMALPIGFTIYIAQVTSGKDPGDMATADPEGWNNLLNKPIHFIDWLYQTVAKQNNFDKSMSAEQKRKIAAELVPMVQLIEEPIALEEATTKLAVILQTSTTAATELIFHKKSPIEIKTELASPQKTNIDSKEWLTLGMAYLYPTFIPKLNEVVKFSEKEVSEIYIPLQKAYNIIVEKGGKQTNRQIKSYLDRMVANKLDIIALEIQKNFNLCDQDAAKQIIKDIFQYYKQSGRDQLKQDFAQKIREAELSGNREEVKNLLENLSKLIK